MSAKKELEDKNKIIEEQLLLLNEYRNTIKFLELRQNKTYSAINFIQRVMDTGWNLTSEQRRILFNSYF